jgi:hypothetical protein
MKLYRKILFRYPLKSGISEKINREVLFDSMGNYLKSHQIEFCVNGSTLNFNKDISFLKTHFIYYVLSVMDKGSISIEQAENVVQVLFIMDAKRFILSNILLIIMGSLFIVFFEFNFALIVLLLIGLLLIVKFMKFILLPYLFMNSTIAFYFE